MRGSLIAFVVFCILFVTRWYTYPLSLPQTWTPESRIRYTARILEEPEHTDSKTIIRQGRWLIVLDGYQNLNPGTIYAFSGTVKTRVLLSKVFRIEMVDPTFEILEGTEDTQLTLVDWFLLTLSNWRDIMVARLKNSLPEPHASMAAGILLGVRASMPRDFYNQLVATGTLHIVAASGFNVMVVASVLMGLVSWIWRRGVAIGVGIVGIVLYVLLAGASASVVRAGVMGSLTLTAYYFGRPAFAKRLLWVSAGLMLLVSPLLILDIGFQLSIVATAGILYLQPWMKKLSNNVFLSNYLYPTLAASVATAPIILWHFERISWVSPLVNGLVLPLIPLIMGLSVLMLLGGHVLAWLAYVPLAYVVWMIRLFG